MEPEAIRWRSDAEVSATKRRTSQKRQESRGGQLFVSQGQNSCRVQNRRDVFQRGTVTQLLNKGVYVFLVV